MLTLGLAFAGGLRAQSIGPATLNAAGGQSNIGGNTYEYSFGELTNTQTMTANNFVITHGVLQPFYFTAEGIDETAILTDLISLFPTVGSGSFQVKIDVPENGKIDCTIYDMTGKVIQKQTSSKNSATHTMSFDIENLPAANYFVLVALKNKTTQYSTFKIQKI